MLAKTDQISRVVALSNASLWGTTSYFYPFKQVFVLYVLQDRADRAARYSKTQEEEKAAREAILQAKQAEQEARKATLVRERRQVV